MNLLIAIKILVSVNDNDDYIYDKYPVMKCRDEYKYLENEGLIDRITSNFTITKEGRYVIERLRQMHSEAMVK